MSVIRIENSACALFILGHEQNRDMLFEDCADYTVVDHFSCGLNTSEQQKEMQV